MIKNNPAPDLTDIDPWLIAEVESAFTTVLDDDDATPPPPQLTARLAAALRDGGKPAGGPQNTTTPRPRHNPRRLQRPWQRAPPPHPRL